MALLTPEQKRHVAEAIARVEEQTAGELVVVTAKRADLYVAVRALWALPITVFVVGELFIQLPHVPSWIFFVSQIPLGLALYALLGWGPLLRLLVPRKVRDAAVDACAKRLFIEFGITETRDRSGVLILLCETEHRVQLLADSGIHRRVPTGEWQKDVDQLSRAIREGRAAEGLLAIVEAVGALLAANFAQNPLDTNELSDSVREI